MKDTKEVAFYENFSEGNKVDISADAELVDVDIDIHNPNEIMQYGEDSLSKIREVSQSITRELDSRSGNTDLLDNLNNVLDNIDYDELQLAQSNDTGIQKLINKVTRKKNRIINKYMGISSSIDGMYAGIKTWQANVLKNNESLYRMLDVIDRVESSIEKYKNNGKMIASRLNQSGEHEKQALMLQNVQDFEFAITTCQQMKKNIDIQMKTNTTIYNKLKSVYHTTMPIIHSNINLIDSMEDSRNIINGLKIIDETRDKMLKFGTKEAIRLGKESVNQLGKSEADFKVLDDTIKELETGIDDIKKLEQEKIDSINKIIALREEKNND